MKQKKSLPGTRCPASGYANCFALPITRIILTPSPGRRKGKTGKFRGHRLWLPSDEKIAKLPLPPVILTLSLPKGKNPTYGAKTLRSAQGNKMKFCNFLQ